MSRKIAQNVLNRHLRRRAGDIPKTVERYVKEHKEQGMEEDKAWAVAWSRYCVAGTTLIPTERGLVSVSDIYANSQGQKVIHSDGVEARKSELMVASKSGRSVSSHIIHTGKKAVMDVETKHGYKLTSTPDHQILVLNEKNYGTEWVDVQDSLGRYAILPTQGVWGTKTVLPKFHYKANAWNNVVPLKQPTEMSPELARMLGYLVSEGSVTDEGVEFSNTNSKVIQDFVRCSTAVFGQEPIVEWRDRSEDNWKDCGKVRLRTRWYSEFFTLIGLPPGVAQDKEVPHVILSAPKRFVREFLVGFVEGDGYTGDVDHQNRIDLSTSSDTLARQLHLLLLNFGLPSTLEHTKRGYFNVRIHSKPMAKRYVERVGTAFKKVAISGKRSRKRGSEFEMVPASSLLELGSKIRTAFPGTKRVSLSKILRNWDALEASRGSDGIVDNIRALIDNKYLFDKITDVKSSGQVDVFDLSVPSDTSFVANGLVAHNCKYKYPNSPRCKQKDYFPGRKNSSLNMGNSSRTTKIASHIALRCMGGSLKQAINMDYYDQQKEVPWLFMETDPYSYAISELRKPLVRWQEFEEDKGAIFRAYSEMHPDLKKALDDANRKVMSGPIVAWRREPSGRFPSNMGGMSLHLEVEPHLAKQSYAFDELQPYLVKPSDVLIHPDIPDNPLGKGRWAWERELILKPGASPKLLGESKKQKLLQQIAKRASLTKVVASRYIEALSINLSDRFRDRFLGRLKAYIRRGLSPFPSMSPQRAESKLAQELVEAVKPMLRGGETLSIPNAHEFVRSLVRSADFTLGQQAFDILGDRADRNLKGRLTNLLEKMAEGLASDPSSGPAKAQKKAVRLLVRELGLEEWEAQQTLDQIGSALNIEIPMASDQINLLLASYLESSSRAARKNTKRNSTLKGS